MVRPLPEDRALKKIPDIVPAYTYTGSIRPTFQSPQQAQAKQQKVKKTSNNKPLNQSEKTRHTKELSKTKPAKETVYLNDSLQKKPASPTRHFGGSLLSSSLNQLKQEQVHAVTHPRDKEPVYLIGDDNAAADPLIKLMGRSLSAHFRYPDLAGKMGIKGKVLIALTLHPEGHYSHVQIIKSSHNQELDAAALYAVNTAPIVKGADRFLSKPRHFIVGFIFR